MVLLAKMRSGGEMGLMHRVRGGSYSNFRLGSAVRWLSPLYSYSRTRLVQTEIASATATIANNTTATEKMVMVVLGKALKSNLETIIDP